MSVNSPTLFKNTQITPKENMSENQATTFDNETKGMCARFAFQVIASIGMVVWEIFAIIALVNNSDETVKSNCENSNLWTALLCTCIITGLNLLFNNKHQEKDESNKLGGISGCLGLGVFIWLCVELFNDCAISNLRNNQIHIMGYIYFWIIICLTSLLSILLFCGGCCICIGMMTEKETREPDPLSVI